MIPASDIDRLLLSCCDAHWRKVARIIGQTYGSLEERGIAISGGIAKLMDARMAVLVRSGKLEAKGNIKRWRYGEVRLARACQLIKTADWLIDLGPEGGDGRGEIVAASTPEDVVREKRSYTGAWFSNGRKSQRSASKRKNKSRRHLHCLACRHPPRKASAHLRRQKGWPAEEKTD